MNKSRLMTLGPVMFFAIILSSLTLAANDPPNDVVNAAESGIRDLIKSGVFHDLDLLGFPGQHEIDDAALGEGFQIFTVGTAVLVGDTATSDLSTNAYPLELWQFLVMSRSEARCILTVGRVKGKWTAVSIGATGLAMRLSGAMKAWPRSLGYQYRFIRLYQASSDFLELSGTAAVIGFLPLASAREALNLKSRDFDVHDIRSSWDILNEIRPVVKANLQKGEGEKR